MPTRLSTRAITVSDIYIYINNLSKIISDKSIPILFADDTSFIITNHDNSEFRHIVNEVFNKINKCFHSNLLMLNYDKTYFLQFTTKANKENNIQILYSNKTIATVKSIKCLGLTLDTTLNWKHHISELNTQTKQSLLCYQVNQAVHVTECTEKYVFLVCTFHYVVWTHIFRKFN